MVPSETLFGDRCGEVATRRPVQYTVAVFEDRFERALLTIERGSRRGRNARVGVLMNHLVEQQMRLPPPHPRSEIVAVAVLGTKWHAW